MFQASLKWTGTAAVALALTLGGCSDDNSSSPQPDQGMTKDDGALADQGMMDDDGGGDAMMAGDGSAGVQLKVEITNVSSARAFVKSGAFDTPVGKSSPGPALPGDAFEVTFSAPLGSALSFATMFGQSNDLFYAPDEQGIALYGSDGTPTSGDVTAMVKLWDAGTEKNEEPGLGPSQAPRQGAKNTGPADPNNTVRPAEDSFNNLPAVSDVIKVTLTPMAGSMFRLRIEDVSTASTLKTSDNTSHPAPVSPGVWVVHTMDAPLFESGKADRGDGLEAQAEDGDPSTLAATLAADSGVTQLVSPGVWVVHSAGMPLFASGKVQRGDGLEAQAEDGDPSTLAAAVSSKAGVESSGTFTTPDGASQAGPLGPGQRYSFTITAMPGDRLSFTTMLGQSNDLFLSPDDTGVALFDAGGQPVSDITPMIRLWDAGTEKNQEPGIGPDQAPRQAGKNTGEAESKPVGPVSDGFTYPEVSDLLEVTISPL